MPRIPWYGWATSGDHSIAFRRQALQSTSAAHRKRPVDRSPLVFRAGGFTVAKAKFKRNPERENRIEEEIVCDAHNAEERAMGWYYYLEEMST